MQHTQWGGSRHYFIGIRCLHRNLYFSAFKCSGKIFLIEFLKRNILALLPFPSFSFFPLSPVYVGGYVHFRWTINLSMCLKIFKNHFPIGLRSNSKIKKPDSGWCSRRGDAEIWIWNTSIHVKTYISKFSSYNQMHFFPAGQTKFQVSKVDNFKKCLGFFFLCGSN